MDTFTQAEPYALTENERDQFRALWTWRHNEYDDELDPLRVLHFQRLLTEVARLPSGDYIEMGTQHGCTAKVIFDLMVSDAHLYCFDTFEGFHPDDLKIEDSIRAHGFTTDSIPKVDFRQVPEKILGVGRTSDRLTLVPGRVPHTLEPFAHLRFRFAHLDMDLYEPTAQGLSWLWPRMVPGGLIFLHDYDALPSVRKAVDEFARPKGLLAIPMSDRFGSSLLFKSPG
ncbi:MULTISPECIES: TylF/MycF/NovP-related O-methyltransferase [unclassified Bradyrhizobium]|uniref:TylF/MycF/NovP-related O-methyltransferase n=1 Tax=unclassified Bradyrhizobium TaxID=2631580 RepID=UPI0028EDBFF1|nr:MULTISPECIES: TylF/MycF/NovP-related O-methyltransferase [unclassified Bradyrhizobium]